MGRNMEAYPPSEMIPCMIMVWLVPVKGVYQCTKLIVKWYIPMDLNIGQTIIHAQIYHKCLPG